MTTLLIAMPTSGQVHTETFKAVIGLTQRFQRARVRFALKTYEFSDLVISRNYLMSYFLKQTEFTHTLLLDSDMSFSPALILRMLELDEDFVCAAYPQRSVSFHSFRAAVERDMQKPPESRTPTEDLVASVLRYNVQGLLHADEDWVAQTKGGFRTVPGAGTGLMLIKRNVPETMVARGVAGHRPRHEALPVYSDSLFHDFFSHLTDRDGKVMYGEDQSFCRRWVEGCGGDIWCDETAVVVHHGEMAYRGDYSKRQR